MNFYKITNKKEKHNSLRYKTGLNVDPLPWNPSGDCEPGGIYFSREDILAFIEYGPWIRKVTIPYGIEVYENPGEPKKWKAHKVILGERREINTNIISRLLKEGANIHVDNEWVLKWASRNGNLGLVKFLVEHGSDIHTDNDRVLRWASRDGYLEIVKLLLEHRANVHAKGNCALEWASERGHLKIVKLLIKHGANVRAVGDYALEQASMNRYTEIIDLLFRYGITG